MKQTTFPQRHDPQVLEFLFVGILFISSFHSCLVDHSINHRQMYRLPSSLHRSFRSISRPPLPAFSCRASLSSSSFSSPPPPDAVIILAGGLLSDGSLPPWVVRRMEKAIELQKAHAPRLTSTAAIGTANGNPSPSSSVSSAAPLPLLCLGGGTPHRPPILMKDRGGHVLHEATACADWLLERNVEPTSILKEISSYDTVGNGYFAATIHAIPAGWRHVSIVTSDFHMPRTRAIFDHVFHVVEASGGAMGGPRGAEEEAGGSGRGEGAWVDLEKLTWHFPHRHFCLTYHSVSDEGIFPEEILAARAARERSSLRGYLEKTRRLKTLRDYHTFIHAEHGCYAAALQDQFGARMEVDDKALMSY